MYFHKLLSFSVYFLTVVQQKKVLLTVLCYICTMQDLEQRIKDLNKANEDFKSEIAQRTQEAKQLQEEIGERQRLTAHAGKEMVSDQGTNMYCV